MKKLGISVALNDVQIELAVALGMYPTMHSLHEGYAVILEELDEAWEEIKKKQPDLYKVRKEMIQVAAMAVRFIVELTPTPEGENE